MDDEERIAIATGARPLALDAVVGHGAPSHRRWRVKYDDRPPAFAKIAAFDYTADWLRTEHANYAALAGQPYLSPVLGWHDDGEHPALVIEDLSDAVWPPPWTTERIDAVLDALSAIHATAPPASIGERVRGIVRHPRKDGRRCAPTRPRRSRSVSSAAGGPRRAVTLAAAAGSADLGGDALLHGDVRSDNLCFRDGRAVLVDWNWACRGDRRSTCCRGCRASTTRAVPNRGP